MEDRDNGPQSKVESLPKLLLQQQNSNCGEVEAVSLLDWFLGTAASFTDSLASTHGWMLLRSPRWVERPHSLQ